MGKLNTAKAALMLIGAGALGAGITKRVYGVAKEATPFYNARQNRKSRVANESILSNTSETNELLKKLLESRADKNMKPRAVQSKVLKTELI